MMRRQVIHRKNVFRDVLSTRQKNSTDLLLKEFKGFQQKSFAFIVVIKVL